MTYQVGTRVRVRTGDPDHHTRVPRYVRGHTGEIVAALGRWPVKLGLPQVDGHGMVTAAP